MRLHCSIRIAVVAALATTVPQLHAQSTAGIPRSQTVGPLFGVQLGTTLLSATRTAAHPGAGGGVMVGFGFSPRLMAFANVDVSLVYIYRDQYGPPLNYQLDGADVSGSSALRSTTTSTSDEPRRTSVLMRDVVPIYVYFRGNNTFIHVDAGVRYSFANVKRAWVPYLTAALSQRSASVDRVNGRYRTSGVGFTLGGGTQYFVGSSTAIDLGILVSRGRTSPGESVANGPKEPIVTSRIGLGLRYYPRSRQ